MPQQANTPVTRSVCHKTWLVTPQHARAHKGFCAEHRLVGSHCTLRATMAARPRVADTPNRICQVCQRPFYAKRVHIEAGIALTCSNRCRGASMQIPISIPDSEIDLAYMAGIIDGEGTITATRTTRNPQTGLQGMACRVIVANSHVGLMEWLCQKFGGRLHTPTKTRRPHHKPVLVWWAGSDQAITLCRELLPYLKVKRRQAEILIALSELRWEMLPGVVGRYVSAERRAAREPLLAEMRQLNHRGLRSDQYQLDEFEESDGTDAGLGDHAP